ncbi:MAG: Uma2 family endonuclease [Acidobacteriota bacterium]
MTAQILEQERPFTVALDFHSVRLTEEQFYQLCQDNDDLRLELTAEGELIIMPPTGGTTGSRNADITFQIVLWAKKDGTGLSFDSSTMFILPNGAKRSPDASWVSRERWDALSEEQRERFVPLCPDFVLELRSATDRLSFLQDKTQEYIANGAQLGLLIDPQSKQAYVYRPNQPVECLDNPQSISGEPALPGFALDLKDIW